MERYSRGVCMGSHSGPNMGLGRPQFSGIDRIGDVSPVLVGFSAHIQNRVVGQSDQIEEAPRIDHEGSLHPRRRRLGRVHYKGGLRGGPGALAVASAAFMIFPGWYIDELPPCTMLESSTDQDCALRSSTSVSVAYSDPPTWIRRPSDTPANAITVIEAKTF